MNKRSKLSLIDDLAATLAELRAAVQLDEVPPAIPVPGQRPANAYDGARALWEAAQREGQFKIHDWVGPGLQPGAAQLGAPVQFDSAAFGDAVAALGGSDWGRTWLSIDVNATMLDPAWQKFFNGYIVRRASNNPDDGLVRVS